MLIVDQCDDVTFIMLLKLEVKLMTMMDLKHKECVSKSCKGFSKKNTHNDGKLFLKQFLEVLSWLKVAGSIKYC